jgi:hypothetical protein
MGSAHIHRRGVLPGWRYRAKQPRRHALSLADRDDICEALRDPAGWTGYDAGNTSTDIGLCDRKRESDEMERDEALYTLRMTWQCHVKEIEG